MSIVFMRMYLLPLKNVFSGLWMSQIGMVGFTKSKCVSDQGSGYILLLLDMSLVSLYIYRICAKIRLLQGKWINSCLRYLLEIEVVMVLNLFLITCYNKPLTGFQVKASCFSVRV